MNIGERIRNKRVELGLTQDELAKMVGYQSRSSINKIETSRNLPLSKVEKVAKALNCKPTELMGWDTDEALQDSPIFKHIYSKMSPEERKKDPFYRELKNSRLTENISLEKEDVDLLNIFKQLNTKGKMKAYEQVEMLTKIPDFRILPSVPLTNAAHADNYSVAPEELKKQEEDIMDDENF